MKYKYTRTKVFHFPERIGVLPRESGKIPPPIHIRIKPTNHCNHVCNYCAYSVKTLRQFGKDSGKGPEMIPREKMMEIIEDLIRMDVKAVTFSGGGEPFTYPFFKETAVKLASSPVHFASLTNGSLLSGEIAEVFAKHATWVRVSIDGWDEESYSTYRKVAHGEYARVIGNMENFKKLGGRCSLGVSLIVDERNGRHIYQMLERFRDIGVDNVKMSPCLVSDNAEENGEYHKASRNWITDEIQRTTGSLSGPGFQIFDAYGALDEKFAKEYRWCPCLQLLPVIGADLNVYSCPDKAYDRRKGLLGNIANTSFREFWCSDKNRFFQLDPSVDCVHHCERNPLNNLILEYLFADDGHLGFV